MDKQTYGQIDKQIPKDVWMDWYKDEQIDRWINKVFKNHYLTSELLDASEWLPTALSEMLNAPADLLAAAVLLTASAGLLTAPFILLNASEEILHSLGGFSTSLINLSISPGELFLGLDEFCLDLELFEDVLKIFFLLLPTSDFNSRIILISNILF